MVKQNGVFLFDLNHLPFRNRILSTRFVRTILPSESSPESLKIKSKIHEGVSGIPTIPNDDESLVPRIDQPCLHARSTLKIPDYPFHPCSLYFSPSRISLHPFESASTIGPSPEKGTEFIFSRCQIYISFHFHALHFRHDSYHSPRTRFKFKIELAAFQNPERRETKYSYSVFRVSFSFFFFFRKKLVLLIK